MALFTELKSKHDDLEDHIRSLHQFISEDKQIVRLKYISIDLLVNVYSQSLVGKIIIKKLIIKIG